MITIHRPEVEEPTQLGVFATYAPRLHAAGFSPVPITPDKKKPSINGWSGYCDNHPRLETLREWMDEFPFHGIGICLGREVRPGYRLAGVDDDVEALRGPIRGLLGNPKCSKRGKKGETFFVLAEKSLKSTSLKYASGKQAVDILIGGKQTVLPPTIHPDTGQPYVWIGSSLLDITLDDLPVLDARKFNILRTLVASEHTAALIAGVSNDDA